MKAVACVAEYWRDIANTDDRSHPTDAEDGALPLTKWLT